MQHERLIPAVSEKKLRCLLIVCALTILCFSQSTLAQSGRRQNKNPSPTPPVIVEPKTESPAKPPVQKPKPIATIIVGGDKLGSSIYIPYTYVEMAIHSCVDRLMSMTVFEVTGGSSMTRKEAIDRAKKEKDAHVLWLEVRVEADRAEDVSISYTVFTPQTAKVMTSGRVDLGSRGTGLGGIRVGVPTATRRLPLDYQMKEAGRDVADRVASKFRTGGRD